MPRKKTTGRGTNGADTIRKKTVIRQGKEYTYWEARFTEGYNDSTGKQIQRSITGKTQKEVAQKLRQITTELDNGSYRTPVKMTVEEWLTIWLNEYTGAVKPSTHYLYERTVTLNIIPTLGRVKLENLTPQMIQKYYNNLLHPTDADVNPLSPKSIKNVHGILHKALQQEVIIGYLKANPANGCVLPRIEKPDIHPMDEQQTAAFVQAIHGHRFERILLITLFTGMREGEVLGLTWDCVDFENGTLLIKQQLRREQKKGGTFYLSSPKNGKSRIVALPPTLVQQFRLQRAEQERLRTEVGSLWIERSLVFTNPIGDYLSYRTVYDSFKRIVKRLGMPNIRFHDLRHTYAVNAIRSGDDIRTVQESLGHATAAFTLDVYGHVTAQMKRDSAGRMEKLIQTMTGSQ